MEFVILSTVSQLGLSTESKTFHRASHTVWKIACESIFIYIILFSNGLIFFFFFFFFFFFDGVTVNPDITKKEGTAFFAKKKVVLLLARITPCKYSVCLQTQA